MCHCLSRGSYIKGNQRGIILVALNDMYNALLPFLVGSLKKDKKMDAVEQQTLNGLGNKQLKPKNGTG